MSHLLLIFGLGLGGGGFLFREAHPQARDELPGQGAPGEEQGQGQDGQALQRVLTAGPRVALPAPASSCRGLNTFQERPGRGPRPVGEAAGILPLGGCWQSGACPSCQPLPRLGTGKAGRERSLQHLPQGGSSGESDKGSCLHPPTAGDLVGSFPGPLCAPVPPSLHPGGAVSRCHHGEGTRGAALLLPLTKLQ